MQGEQQSTGFPQWCGGVTVGRGYLVYRWLVSLLTLTLLAQSLIPRLLYSTHKVRDWLALFSRG